MQIKYGAEISNEAIVVNLKRLTNQIFKLLPLREEGGEWKKPLETIVIELTGMSRLFVDQHVCLFTLLSKLEGLFILNKAEDFLAYRSTIFESLGLLGKLIEYVGTR